MHALSICGWDECPFAAEKAHSFPVGCAMLFCCSVSLCKPLIETSQRVLLYTLVPSLTFTISAATSHALTRSPHEDYYCWFCQTQQIYCKYCGASRDHTYQVDYYQHHYALYYARYYAKFYSMQVNLDQFIHIGI